jgi:hypothetical protein
MWDAEKLDKLRASGLLHELKGAAHWCDSPGDDEYLTTALNHLSIVIDAISDLLLGLED